MMQTHGTCSKLLPFALIFTLVIPLYLEHSLFTNDTWYHLAIGQEIIARRALPEVEWRTFTSEGKPLFVNGWLSGAIFAVAERIGGLPLVELTCLALVYLILVLVYMNSKELGAPSWAALLAVFVFVRAAHSLLIIRPQLFTFICFGTFFLIYLRLRKNVPIPLWPFPLIMTFWANAHFGFILGIAFLAGTALHELVIRFLDHDPAALGRARALGIALVASLFASILTPYGINIFLFVAELDPFVQGISKHINEWLPASPNMTPWFYESVAAGIVLALFQKAPRCKFELLAFFITATAAISSWRHVPIYGISGLPVAAAWLGRIFKGGSLRVHLSDAAGLCIIAILMSAHILRTSWDGETWALFRQRFPVAAVDWIKRHPQSGRMYNPFEWGGGRHVRTWTSWIQALYRHPSRPISGSTGRGILCT